MRFVQFRYKPSDNIHVGMEVKDKVIDLVELGVKNMVDFIQGGESLLQESKRIASYRKFLVPKKEITLCPPITKPDKVICIGMNYKDHCEEQGAPVPKEPVVFNKFPSCIVGPYDPIPFPDVTKELDWEVELAVVIGKSGKNIPESTAMDHVFGYTVAHDVSAREWQLKKNGGQWLLGKAMDGFCPIGPSLVTPDEVGNLHNLAISCKVNDILKQSSNTNQLVFNTGQIIAWVSQFCTLLPGDLILTGTPPGVGVFMKPPEFLKRGDIVECYVEGIGSIKNEII